MKGTRSRRRLIPRGLTLGCLALGLGLVVVLAALAAFLTASCVLACPANPTTCQHATQECVAAEQQGDLEWMTLGVVLSAIGAALVLWTRMRLRHWTVHVRAEDGEWT